MEATSTNGAEHSPVAFRHCASKQARADIPLIANDNAFLGDVFSRCARSGWLTERGHSICRQLTDRPSEKIDPDHAISCGLYRLEPGAPLDYTYTYQLSFTEFPIGCRRTDRLVPAVR